MKDFSSLRQFEVKGTHQIEKPKRIPNKNKKRFKPGKPWRKK